MILLFAVLAVMIFVTWRNGKKRKAEAEEMQAKFLPGAEVMTQQGIFGTIVSTDEDTNQTILETVPGSFIRVHRQSIARIVEPEVADDEALDGADAAADDVESNTDATEPEFGERAPKKAKGDAPSDSAE